MLIVGLILGFLLGVVVTWKAVEPHLNIKK
jgi:hypothetical protein